MYWNNTTRDGPPDHGTRVLISVKGIYYLAKCDCEGNCFVVVLENEDQLRFSWQNETIYWTEYLNAPPGTQD